MVDWQYISEAAQSLCEDAGVPDQNERAILWYGLQTEVIAPKAPRIVKFARTHAALKLLDSIEAKSHLSSSALFAERLALPGYERLVSNLLTGIGGWRQLGTVLSRAALAEDLSVRWKDARDAARIVEFSYRFDQTVNSSKIAGSTMGREFVVRAFQMSDGTAKTRWKEYGDLAVLRLILGKMKLKPVSLKSGAFAERLVAQASDAARIRTLFGCYEHLAKRLRPRGYKYQSLGIPNLSGNPNVFVVKPFSDRENEFIADI